MLSPKTVLLAVLLLNTVAFLFVSLNISQKSNDFLEEDPSKKQDLTDEDIEVVDLYKKPTPKKQIPRTVPTQGPYAFSIPSIAHQILKNLDIFEEVKTKSVKKYSGPAGGLKANNNYCEQHRAYFVEHPDLVFQKPGIVTNYWKNHKLRTQVIPKVGQDLHPLVYPGAKHNKSFDIRLDANMFFTYNLFYEKRQLGKQFSCLSQSSNHIPGHDKMARKDYVGQALVDYAKRYKSRPNCFNFNKYFPQTWILQKKDQCLDFFNKFQNKNYLKLKQERNIVFFRKKPNVHEGKGVFPVNNNEEAYLKKLYKNGTACGKIKDNNMIQYNIHNLLLIQERKFGLRMFLLIASTNPLIAYYHDGYARLSMNEYNPNSQKIETFVTNIGVNLKEAQKGTVFSNLSSAEVQERTSWSLEDLQNYLLEIGRIKDTKWLNNYFRREMKKVMIHLLRMAQSSFFKKSSIFELFGLDFVMDENLDLWFIEANSMPLINGFTKRSTKLMNTMLIDTFEIVLGLQKSRMKRVINYVNALTEDVALSASSELKGLKEKRREFQRLTMNYFEPEFEPSLNNTFEKIIDENLQGTLRYDNLIEFECL